MHITSSSSSSSSSSSLSGRTYSSSSAAAAENSYKFMRDLCAGGMAQTSRMHLGSTRGTGELIIDARARAMGEAGNLGAALDQ